MCTYWYIGLALIGLIVIFSVVVAKMSALLRDSVSDRVAFRTAARKKYPEYANDTDAQIDDKVAPPYSLSRLQLLVWTVVISCSYIYVVFCLNNDPSVVIEINKTALFLLGISLVTKGAASTIDNAQSEGKRNQDEPSTGFFTDILSDDEGVSIHRMQNFIWSVIAITVYICILFGDHTSPAELPTLDNTLLILTGLSSAGYLGMKLGENSETN